MVTVVDIGNTNIHVGLYLERKLVWNLVYSTCSKSFSTKMESVLSRNRLEGVAIASVVPSATRKLVAVCRRYRIKPLVVSSKLKCGLRYRYHDPATLGADRIAVVVGALVRSSKDVIVIDAGTAITIDVARQGGDYLGGIICPGMSILAESLQRKTAQLPRVKVGKPDNVIGRSTQECMRSGIFNGTMAMIEGLIRTIKKQVKGEFACIATGGSGEVIAENVRSIVKYDGNLGLYGTLEIYYKNA
jgi:type III pantothenate kinase